MATITMRVFQARVSGPISLASPPPFKENLRRSHSNRAFYVLARIETSLHPSEFPGCQTFSHRIRPCGIERPAWRKVCEVHRSVDRRVVVMRPLLIGMRDSRFSAPKLSVESVNYRWAVQ